MPRRRCGAPTRYADRAELARLEIALAAAQSDAGQWEAARASYARAASAAREAGAADAFALAALGHAGGTWEQFGVADAENVTLIEEALRRLPAEDSPMRAQVLAKLAIHRRFEVDSPRPTCARSPTMRSRWRAGSGRPSRWRRP